jgi:hypothetical protein
MVMAVVPTVYREPLLKALPPVLSVTEVTATVSVG